MSVYKAFGHIDVLIFWNPLIEPHYQIDKQLNQRKIFKVHILKLEQLQMKKLQIQKYPNMKLRP
jgi:hypothetical protein